MEKHQVHNLIILDESGSMESIKNSIISGFNETVQNIKGIELQFPEQQHSITIISFNGLGNKVLHFNDPVSKLQTIDDSRYKPDSMTPLYDAIGFSLKKLRELVENQTGYNVLVTIMTDGEENASREYSGQAIRSMIEELKKKNWTFTYIGADHDVEKFAKSISVNNSLAWQKDTAGTAEMFAKDNEARIMYAMKIRNKQHVTDDYFDSKPDQNDLDDKKNKI
ncbi:MAG: VWA domain-containing protein [Deltaproteobacteria bacterium]